MTEGCPACPDRERADKAELAVIDLRTQHRRAKIRAILFGVLFFVLESALFGGILWLEKESDYRGQLVCRELVEVERTIYFKGKCYLPEDDGNLSFLVDLDKLDN